MMMMMWDVSAGAPPSSRHYQSWFHAVLCMIVVHNDMHTLTWAVFTVSCCCSFRFFVLLS